MGPFLSRSAVQNAYKFAACWPIDKIDFLGQKPITPDPGVPPPDPSDPREGKPCCEKPCKVTAKMKHVSCTPVPAPDEIPDQGFDINVEIDITTVSGVCPAFTCDYWNCDDRELPGPGGGPIPIRWPASCGAPGYTYELRGDDDAGGNDNYHMKAIGGRVWYLSCEQGVWTKKGPIDIDGMACLKYFITYDPAECTQ